MKAPLESVIAAKLAAQRERWEMFRATGVFVGDDGKIVQPMAAPKGLGARLRTGVLAEALAPPERHGESCPRRF